jgi:hypothetical protein
LVDIQTVSIAIASAGVFLAAIYYILQIRNQTKIRQTDVVWRMFQTWNSVEFTDALPKAWNMALSDFEEFTRKYGVISSENNPAAKPISMVATYFEQIGFLVAKKLISLDHVYQLLPVTPWWEKLKPTVEGIRKQLNMPESYCWFEYLYNECKKREDRGVKHG